MVNHFAQCLLSSLSSKYLLLFSLSSFVSIFIILLLITDDLKLTLPQKMHTSSDFFSFFSHRYLDRWIDRQLYYIIPSFKIDVILKCYKLFKIQHKFFPIIS